MLILHFPTFFHVCGVGCGESSVLITTVRVPMRRQQQKAMCQRRSAMVPRAITTLILLSIVLPNAVMARRPPPAVSTAGHRRLAQRRLEVGPSLPQGVNPVAWGPAARVYLDRITDVLTKHFPEAMSAGKRASRGQQLALKILPVRWLHYFYRMERYVKQDSSVLVLGDSGPVTALVQDLLMPQWLRATTLNESSGVSKLAAEDSSLARVDLGVHDLQRDPLPVSANSVDHVILFDLMEHMHHDPFYILLEAHRVLKPNGTLFLSTPNLISFSSVARALVGASPYTLSKYEGSEKGDGVITHSREYSWGEMTNLLKMAGFASTLLSFNGHPADDRCWDHSTGRPRPQYKQLLSSFPTNYRNLERLGSTLFVAAHKGWKPTHRYPQSLYRKVPAQQAGFKEYPACSVSLSYCDEPPIAASKDSTDTAAQQAEDALQQSNDSKLPAIPERRPSSAEEH